MSMTAERTIEAQIRSAARIEPEKLPRLKILGEEWAKAAIVALADVCPSPITAECLGVTNLALKAGATEIGEAAICVMAKPDQWQETGFLLGDADVFDFFAEAFFGGAGKSRAPAGAARRPSTALDRQLATKALASFIEAANPVFVDVAPLDMRPGRTFTASIASALDELLSADNRAFVVMAFRLKLGEMSVTLRAAIPEKAFATHRRKLSKVPEKAAPPTDEAWAKNIQEGLQLADLEVRALLDERQITLGEVARFAIGQTIVLDASMDSLIVVECEEQRLFRGRMGMTRDAYVVRIEEKIDPTEEFIDDILAD